LVSFHSRGIMFVGVKRHNPVPQQIEQDQSLPLTASASPYQTFLAAMKMRSRAALVSGDSTRDSSRPPLEGFRFFGARLGRLGLLAMILSLQAGNYLPPACDRDCMSMGKRAEPGAAKRAPRLRRIAIS
jgi:hypothetical protein